MQSATITSYLSEQFDLPTGVLEDLLSGKRRANVPEPMLWNILHAAETAPRENYDAAPYVHARRAHRLQVRIPTWLEFLDEDDLVTERVEAEIFDLSPWGALVGNVRSRDGRLPMGFHRLLVLLGDMTLDARLKRFEGDLSNLLGIEFERTDWETRQAIKYHMVRAGQTRKVL